jgi:hypothetical protein
MNGRAALVIAVLALVVAVGGGTVAIATSSGAREKRVVTKIVRRLAPRLSVAHARTAEGAGSAENASQLGGAPASAFEPRVQWALDNSSGTVLAQSGGISVNTAFAASGIYYVGFGASVANRPIWVTPHYGDGGLTAETSVTPCGGPSVPGGFECTSTPGVNDPSHVLVRFHGGSGTDAPFGFYVVVGD